MHKHVAGTLGNQPTNCGPNQGACCTNTFKRRVVDETKGDKFNGIVFSAKYLSMFVFGRFSFVMPWKLQFDSLGGTPKHQISSYIISRSSRITDPDGWLITKLHPQITSLSLRKMCPLTSLTQASPKEAEKDRPTLIATDEQTGTVNVLWSKQINTHMRAL